MAGVLLGRMARSASVEVAGGVLDVSWDEATNQVLLTGPAMRVYAGVTS